MGEFLKCECSHCGQPIEYPSEGTGQSVPCPTCEKPVTLTPGEPPETSRETQSKSQWDQWIALNERLKERRIKSGIPLSDESTAAQASPAYNSPPGEEYKEPRLLFAALSETTIRKTTKTGDTPLHRAARIGRINEIPKHLLTLELFMARNNSGATPIHFAAKHGHLDQVPREFLTKETMTMTLGKGFYFTGSGYRAITDTPLHLAHVEQIPKEFLTPEFLSIEAGGYRNTVLHGLAYAGRLDLVPAIYASSPMWNLRNNSGQTPRDIVEANKEREIYVARARSEPATEKQKEKLRWFGCAFDEGMTKGQASDLIDKCVRDFPEKNRAYYARPATDEQLTKLRLKANQALTYGQAKDMVLERDAEKRHHDRIAEMEQINYEFTILEFLRWRVDWYRHLTYSRVKKAAKALDKSNPGWSKLDNCQGLLLEKVRELFPEFAAKENWQ